MVLLSVYAKAHHDGQQRRQDDDIAAQESGQALGARLDLPRASRPSAQESSEERSALNVDPPGEEEGKVVRRRDRVGRDVGTERGETKGESDKELGGAAVPESDDRGGVPVEGTVDGLTGGRDDDTDEGEGKVDDGDKEHLPVRDGRAVTVSGQVGLGCQLQSPAFRNEAVLTMLMARVVLPAMATLMPLTQAQDRL